MGEIEKTEDEQGTKSVIFFCNIYCSTKCENKLRHRKEDS